MLSALGNRADRRPQRRSRASGATVDAPAPAEAFHLYRQARARARPARSMPLLIPLNDDYTIPLRRAPDIRQACVEAYGPRGDAHQSHRCARCSV